MCFWLLQYRYLWGLGSLHTHTDTHRHAQTHTDTHRHTQYVCVSVCDPPRHVYVSVIMSNSRKIVPFLVFEVPIFTKVLKRQDSDKTPKEQLPKTLRFDLTRLSQIFFCLSISWNFDTWKFLCVQHTFACWSGIGMLKWSKRMHFQTKVACWSGGWHGAEA